MKIKWNILKNKKRNTWSYTNSGGDFRCDRLALKKNGRSELRNTLNIKRHNLSPIPKNYIKSRNRDKTRKWNFKEKK